MPHFECGAFDHPATSPGDLVGRKREAIHSDENRGWRMVALRGCVPAASATGYVT